MYDAGTFRELVSGRSRGVRATLARGVLRLVETPYTWVVNRRNDRYDRDTSQSTRVAVPVVSVGNLTLGGTGKTPMVKWLARWFADRGVRVALVSRGYGAASGELNDEAMELAQALPGVPHVQDAKRVRGAQAAIDRYGAKLIVLDDGFQHRKLARDLDIVLLDATEPFGFEHVFPRGTLREPVAGLRRAQVVCLSRANALDATGREAIRQRVASIAPAAAWCEASHRPAVWLNAGGEQQPVTAFAGRRVAAFCGIGNPAAFRRTLDELGVDVVAWRTFADHHAYTIAEQGELADAAKASGAELLVTTHKDLVKLPQAQLGGIPLWALAIEINFLTGEAALVQALERVLPRK